MRRGLTTRVYQSDLNEIATEPANKTEKSDSAMTQVAHMNTLIIMASDQPTERDVDLAPQNRLQTGHFVDNNLQLGTFFHVCEWIILAG